MKKSHGAAPSSRSPRHRSRTIAVVAAGIVALLLPQAAITPAGADVAADVAAADPGADGGATRNGEVGFTGNAILSKFPCPNPVTNNKCPGSFAGEWAGHVSGVQGLSPFDVAWRTLPGTNGVRANFLYWENCVVSQGGAVLGDAQGSGYAVAADGAVVGNYALPMELPRPVVKVELFFDFVWVRGGTTAAIKLTSATLRLHVYNAGHRDVITGEQYGAATFVALSASNTVPPTCSSPLTDVHGVIAGTIPLADD